MAAVGLALTAGASGGISAWFWAGNALLLGMAAGLLVAVWLGYPLAIAVWARWRPYRVAAPAPPQAPGPRVSLIVSAHNEADSIAARIENLWQQDYPPERLELLIAEDGSSDGTCAQVRRLATHAPYPLRLLSSPHRAGKAAAINRAAAAATGEILIFSDANNIYAPDAVRHLVAPFADPSVGAVTGLKSVATSAGLGQGESLYFRYEAWLAQAEARTGTTVASFGEVLAVRRSSFRPLPTGVMLNDDLALVLAVLQQRQRVMVAPRARSFEYGAAGAAAEWERRQRTTAGRLAALAHAVRQQPGALAGLRRRAGTAATVKLLFHEWGRPVSALALVVALLSGFACLLAPSGTVAAPVRWLAWAQAAIWALVAVVAAQRRRGPRTPSTSLGRQWARLHALYFFCLAQLAAVAGCWRYWRGRQSPLWQRAARAVAEPQHAPYPGPVPTLAIPPCRVSGLAGTPAGELPAMNNRRILQGLFWASSSFVLGKLFTFAAIVVLARLLAPRAFGEVALATSALLVLEIFATLGLTSALIFEQRDTDAAAGICFWATNAAALLEIALGWAFAPLVARFFHEPGLAPMLRVLAIALVATTLGNTHDTLLRRRLDFRRKLIPDLGMAVVKAAACIALAVAGWGAWSLIWGQILGTVGCTLLLWWITPWRPSWSWNAAVARRMVGYAKHIYLLDTSSVLLTNLDTLTIGRMLTDVSLGFYTLAFRVPEVLLISVLNVITRVMFPAFSRLQADRAALQRTVLDTIRYTALLTVPLAAAMAVLARPLVFGIYGRHWGPAVPVLQVLALYAGIRCLTHHFGDAYKAIGRPDILTRVTAAWWILLPPDLILGARWGGIVGVAWGHVITRTLISLLHLYLVSRYLAIRPAALWRTLAPALESAGVMSVALLVLNGWMSAWTPRLELAAIVPAGMAVYAIFLYLRYPAVLAGAVRQLQSWRTRRSLEQPSSPRPASRTGPASPVPAPAVAQEAMEPRP